MKRTPRRIPRGLRRTRAGYTLVEVSVALLVIGIGFTSLLAVFPVGLQWARETATGNTAALAAQTAASYISSPGANYFENRFDYRLRVDFGGSEAFGAGTLWHVYINCYANDTDRGTYASPTNPGKTLATFKTLHYEP